MNFSTEMEQSVLNLKLLVASANGDVNEVHRLANEHADVNFKDSNGNTCLHFAANAKSESEEVARHLIYHGARTNVENNEYKTALDVAFEVNNIAVMDLIEQKMLEETEKLCKENKKNEEERRAYVRKKRQKKSVGLYEATLKREYKYKYEDKEIVSLLNFLWAPLDSGSDEVKLCITLHIGLDKEKSICLIWSAADQKPSFATSWGTARVDDTKLNQYNFIEFPCCRDDPVTFALARAFVLCEWISKLWEKKYAQDRITTEVQRFMDSLESWSEMKSQEWRSFFASVLNEINRTLQKAKKCIDFFKLCSSDISDRKCSLKYKMANAIIYSIETFALQDTHCEIPMSNDYEKRLRKRKKAYFERVYNRITSNSDIDVLFTFSTMRSNILKKSGCFQVSLDTIECFITKTLVLELQTFFAAMTDLAERVVQNQEGSMQGTMQDDSLNVFKKLRKKAAQFLLDGKKETVTDVSDSIREFCIDVDKLESKPDRLQSVVFDLLVNVFPRLDRENSPLKSRLSRLRNDIIHNFQNLTPTKVSQDLPSAINDMYRFELALHMHEAMTVLRHDQALPDLHKDLSYAMNSTGEHYVNLKLYSGTKKGNFLSDSYDSSWMKKGIRIIVQTYVNCLAPILDRDGNEDEDDIVRSLPHLSSFRKREIFEKFWALRNNSKDNKEDHDSIMFLQSELQSHLGLNEREAQLAVQNGVIINNANGMIENKIQSEVEGIFTNIALHNEQDFSNYDVIALLEGLINGTNSSVHGSEGQFGVISMDKASIAERLQLLVTNEDGMELKWGGNGQCVTVTMSSIVLNILKIMNDVQRGYQLKFESVSAAFEDPTFISYLVDKEVEKQLGEGTYRIKDQFRIWKLATQLQHIKFIAPFLCAILLKTQKFDIFDHSSLRVLLECMLQEQIDSSYVEALIALKSEQVTNAMFSVILDQDVSNHKAMYVFTEITMQRSLQRCVKSIQIQYDKTDLSDNKRKLMSLANGAVLEKINMGKLDDAETLLNEVHWCLADFPGTSSLRASAHVSTRRQSCPSPENCIPLTPTHKIITAKTEIFSGLNLLTAKLLNARGTRLCKPREDSPTCEGRKFFERARKTLQKVLRTCKDEELTVKNYMLALARSAYTVDLFVKCQGWKHSDTMSLYNEALNYSKESWNVLCRTVMISNETDCTSFFHRVKGSKRYKELMQDREFWKYMNVPKIRRNIAYFTGRLAGISETLELNKESLKILQQTCDLHANETSPHSALIRSLIQKDRAIQYKCLSFKSDRSKLDHRFYQLKCLELILMHYSSGLGFYGRDYRHIKRCSEEADKVKKYLLKLKRKNP